MDETINPYPKFCTQFSPFTAFRTHSTLILHHSSLCLILVSPVRQVFDLQYSGYQIGAQLNNYYCFPSGTLAGIHLGYQRCGLYW